MNLPRAYKGIVPALLLFLSLIFSGSAFAGVLTEVVLNKSVILNLNKPAERVSVANPAIADLILISPTQVQINGLAIGATSLVVWERGSTKPAFFDINVLGDLAQLEPQLKEIAPNDSITAQYSNDTLVLSGNVANAKTRERAEQIAKAYAIKVLNHINMDNPQQVLLQVKVAQVDKTALKKLGVSAMIKGKSAEGFYNIIGAPSGGATLSSSTSGGGISSTTIGQGTGISASVPGLGSFNPLDAFTAGVSYFPAGIGAVIQALTTKGLAKILAEPNLTVRSGEKGEFLAGSKIPYQVLVSTGGSATTSIVFQDVGVKLNFAPEVLDNGIISLKIDPAEVSSLGGTLQANGYPIINTRNVKTNVEIREGESLILAGLLQENEILSMSKVPLLGDIPILGALFRSTSKELDETELVFFITPKIVKPMAPGTKQELPTDKVPTPEQQNELRWIPLGR